MPYRPDEIEPKWQQFWEDQGTFVAREDRARPKFYALDMFPYPSAQGLHLGHPAGYAASDVVSRFKRAKGYNVLHPMGYDSFGLPAEQYAIEKKVPPQKTTAESIARFRQQLKRLGFSYDWSREVATSDPDYYKWTQFIFTKLYEQGLAYQGESFVNWCAALGTVLANDEVVNGKSERGGHPVERKKMRQWMLRITAFSERLLEGLEAVDWPEPTKTAQREWIGRSTGAHVRFPVVGGDGAEIEVFTTRPDTLWGATYMVLAPEHALVDRITTPAQRAAVEAYREAAAARSDVDRQAAKEKTGVWTGARAKNPVNGAEVPVWIADYVLAGYGTGAIMAVPAHDARDWEFAKRFALPIIEVISGGEDVQRVVHEGEGAMVNSGAFDGTPTANGEAVRRVVAWLEEKGLGRGAVTYKLRDWTFARQRYWGEPIPILKDAEGNPVRALEPDELPLELPLVEDYAPTGTGDSPLARARAWVEVNDPKTGLALQRETDTMPGSAGSSWYFLRYCDPRSATELASRARTDYWMPVDLYVGGPEHRVGHLLYARMWQKALRDLGLARDDEPFQKLRHQGMILYDTFYAYDAAVGEVKMLREHDLKPWQWVAYADGSYRHLRELGRRPSPAQAEFLAAQRPAAGRATLATFAGDEAVEGATTLVAEVRQEKMSKRKGNTIDPLDVVKHFGADALRVYICFMGPLNADKPWQTNGLEGQLGWLKRLWRLYFEGDDDAARVTHDAATEAELRVIHKAIKKVTRDIESLDLNTAISALHVATRDLAALGTRSRAVLAPLAQLVAPFAPHVAEELWARALGHEGGISFAPWPAHDDRYAVDELVTIGVQVQGKTHGTIDLPPDADEAAAVAAARENPAVARALSGKAITKVIYKPGRILNLIAR